MLIIHESHLGQCAGIDSNSKPVFAAERRVVLVPVPADSHRTAVRLAIAANPCTLTKVRFMDYEHFYDEYLYTITTSTEYPKHSRTEFNFRKFKIVINEGLFRYLQDKGWLHKYTAVYELFAYQ